MPQTKRVFSTFRLLYLPFHLFVLFFIGIVEKEVFGENGASWNGFIFLCSALDIIVCYSIFHDVLLKYRHNECFFSFHCSVDRIQFGIDNRNSW